MKTFSQWIENVEARRSAGRTIILNFLKDKLKIDDDDAILGMNTADIDGSVIDDLLARGIVKTTNDSVLDRVKNGITVQELIDMLSAEESGSAMPDTSNIADPRLTGQQHQQPAGATV